MRTNEVITAENYPAVSRTEILNRSRYTYSLKDLSSLGSGFTTTAAAIADAIMKTPSNEGIYRCVFPKGVSGHLAAFKDGSGMLGTIMSEDNRIVAQARWVPVEGSAALAVDPVTLAVAAALVSINKKLDQISRTQEEILHFLHQDKESELEGSVNSLADILDQYRFNSDQNLWKSSKLSVVTTIKGKAESNIIFYRKEIGNILDRQKLLHGYQEADRMKERVEGKFRYYQLSLYLYAYASFLEVLLGNNFSGEFLDHMIGKLHDYSNQYKIDYTKCYDLLEDYMKGTIQSVVLSSIGKSSKAAGNFVARIPGIRKGPVDEALIAAGSRLQGAGSHHGKNAMREFRNNRDAGIQLFIRSIGIISEMSNHPVEILFDKENVYICEQKTNMLSDPSDWE